MKSELIILSIIKRMLLMWYFYPFLKYKLMKSRNLIFIIYFSVKAGFFFNNLSNKNKFNIKSYLLNLKSVFIKSISRRNKLNKKIRNGLSKILGNKYLKAFYSFLILNL